MLQISRSATVLDGHADTAATLRAVARAVVEMPARAGTGAVTGGTLDAR